jgi:hypothetical protein
MDTDEKRIAKALGAQKVPGVNEENLLKFRKYLLGRIDKGTVFTGREDFPWEEKYLIGPGSRAEYERLKKKNPSHTDEYKLIDISAETTEESDLVAQVERLSDKKCFEIGLSWLTTKDKKSKDFQPFDDFAIWVVNWC